MCVSVEFKSSKFSCQPNLNATSHSMSFFPGIKHGKRVKTPPREKPDKKPPWQHPLMMIFRIKSQVICNSALVGILLISSDDFSGQKTLSYFNTTRVLQDSIQQSTCDSQSLSERELKFRRLLLLPA